MNARQLVSRGLVAGLISAAVFAAWFFLVDAVEGNPLRTPAYVGRLLLDSGNSETSRVILFTIVHFAALAVAGIVAALILDAAEVRPNLGLGMIFGFLLFDIAFYGSVIAFGENVVKELGWPKVLIGNVLAGMVIFGYLRVRAGERLLDIRGILQRHTIVRQGLAAGAMGAAVVAIWFFAIDVLQNRVFFTPAALGSALFLGVNQANDVVVRASVIIGYTLVHFAAFIAIGVLAAKLVNEAEHHPEVVIGIALLFVTLEVLSLGLLSAAAAWLFAVIPWWSPIIGNLLSAGAMAAYLWYSHPALARHDLRSFPA